MHRNTPYDIGFRGYSAGGARSNIDKIDDSTLMQETNDATGMVGESWPKSEAPQNYGFTSVVDDAKKIGGQISQCAEGFMSFIGGNRNFPVMGIMDDRRHRLKNLAKDAAKGASAMFGLKEWGQQLLNTEDGWFMTGNTQKKVRLQLVQNQNGQTQQGGQGGGGGGGGGAAAAVAANGRVPHIIHRSKSGVEFEIEVLPRPTPYDAGGGSSGGGGSGGGGGDGAGGSGPTGQKTLHKEDSQQYFDMTTGSLNQANGSVHHEVKSDRSVGYYGDNGKSYRADKGHTHIKNSGASVWVDGACKKSMPFVIAPDGCS